MANGFDSLGRFFSSKRKASAVSCESSTAPSTAPGSPTHPSVEPSFPSPSFIRPKASRMAAREEFRMKQPGNEIDSPERKYSTLSNSSGDTAASRRMKACRPRSVSLDLDQREQLASVFRGFDFPKPPPSRQDNTTPTRGEFQTVFGFVECQDSRPGSPLKAEVPVQRAITPPSSDPEDSPLSRRRPKAKKLQIFPAKGLPTPESSPDFGPTTDWQLQDQKSVDILNEGLCKDIQLQLEQTFGHSSFGKELGQPDFMTPETLPFDDHMFTELSLPGASLQEPKFDDFFNLSDDNVAEFDLEEVEIPSGQAQATVASSVSSLPLREPPLLTLEPPSASRPATAAAFEAARLANRYNFDMLYVVNLWPENDGVNGNGHSMAGMSGRLLAAYGLHNSPSPFQISSDVHMQVLQTDGWLEYRDEQALTGDFARAYACSLYPGHYQEKRLSGSIAASEDSELNKVDRGVVFAGYRKPNADGSIHYSSQEELATLQKDVEAMVEMLIDVHIASQLREAPLLTTYHEETGPIPIREVVA